MYKEYKALRERQLHRSNRWDCLIRYSPRSRKDKEQPACSVCRFDDSRALLIDHVKNNGAEHRQQIGRSSTQLYRFLVANKFPRGFQTLCHNCSAIKEFVRRRKALKKNPLEEE